MHYISKQPGHVKVGTTKKLGIKTKTVCSMEESLTGECNYIKKIKQLTGDIEKFITKAIQ